MIYEAAKHLEVFVRHYMPSGKVWNAKNVIGSNMRALASGFTEEFARGDLTIHNFIQEMMPDTTDEYIGRHERAVGIPDSCFSVAGDLQTRRLNVKTKLALLGLQTRADFEGFASSNLGLNIKVRSGIDHVGTVDSGYETELPLLDITGDFANVKEARNTIVVTTLSSLASFDYDFDFAFGSAEQVLMQCLFTNAKPAHCNILFTTE